jgi:hypothetical protein
VHVELAAPGHLSWPSLDVDLAVRCIDRPDEYPLVSEGKRGKGDVTLF